MSKKMKIGKDVTNARKDKVKEVKSKEGFWDWLSEEEKKKLAEDIEKKKPEKPEDVELPPGKIPGELPPEAKPSMNENFFEEIERIEKKRRKVKGVVKKR